MVLTKKLELPRFLVVSQTPSEPQRSNGIEPFLLGWKPKAHPNIPTPQVNWINAPVQSETLHHESLVSRLTFQQSPGVSSETTCCVT